MRKKYIILGAIVALFITGGIFIWSSATQKHNPTDETPAENVSNSPPDTGINTEVDPDSAQTYDTVYNPSARVHPVTLYGTVALREKIYESRGSVDSIHNDIANALLQYGSDHLNNSYRFLTIDTDSLKVENSSISGILLLDDGTEKSTFSASIISTSATPARALVKVTRESRDNETFTYIGGLQNVQKKGFAITQPDKTAQNLAISGSNREAALSYIKSIGYNPPDFTITFSNYRSPFE